MPRPPEKTHEFSSLVSVVEALRGPEGCPWDKEQTHKTLTQYAIEEAHEFAEAADQSDIEGMVEELGDMLLQVVLNAEIGKQEGKFTLADVIQSITEKMIRRHPHVFADLKVRDAQDVLDRWSHLKAQEKSKAKRNPFEGIPAALPALQRASKIGAKTKSLRFDWTNVSDVMGKVREEIAELEEALQAMENEKANGAAKATPHKEALTHEIGDVLFSVAQLARHLDIDPEQALRQTNQRFEARFLEMQKIAEQQGREFSALKEVELEELWQQAKRNLK